MNKPSPTYFPFWALLAVILTLIFLYSFDLKNLFEQRAQLKAAQAEREKIVPQALTINQTVENLGRDLLSMTNKEARQIVADFKIAPSTPAK